MAEWKAAADEARSVIHETKDRPYCTAAAKLAGQLTKTCVAATPGCTRKLTQ